MKIQYMSDLHLEYPENREYFRKNPVEPLGDILVLAGDIVCEANRSDASEFFNDIEAKFDFIISTMGNHEFYLGEIDYAFPSYCGYLSPNHLLLNNQTVIIENVRFIVSTLWSQVDPQHEPEISRRLNDYRFIKKHDEKGLRNLTVKDSNYYHEISRNFLSGELKREFNGKTVIISHHLPSYKCVIPKWRSSTLASAFVNNLDDLIADNKIDLWIFGHQHEYIDETFSGTRFVENPLGYASEDVFKTFSSSCVVEI